MPAVEVLDAVGGAGLREVGVELPDLVVVEVAVAGGPEVEEREVRVGPLLVGKSRAAAEDARERLVRLERDGDGETRRSRQAAEVGASRIDREARVRVAPDRLERRRVWIVLRVAARAVRRGQDPAVGLGRLAEPFERDEGAAAGVEKIEDGRGPVRRVGGREVERVGLCGPVKAHDAFGDLSGDGLFGGRLVRSGARRRGEDEDQAGAQHASCVPRPRPWSARAGTKPPSG